jgi:hypothetical protein
MGPTGLQLTERLARDLHDVDMKTFEEPVLFDLLNEAIAEINRIAPLEFMEDIDTAEGVAEYPTRITEGHRLEVWDVTLGTTVALTTPFGVAASDTLTSTAHGLDDGSRIEFVTLAGGSGLTTAKPYIIVNATANTFQVALLRGGMAIDFGTDITAGTFRTVEANAPVARLTAAAGEYANDSRAGWSIWRGLLTVTPSTAEALELNKYILRLWGYAPRLRLLSTEDVAELDDDAEFAVRECAVLFGWQRLWQSKAMFTQWQLDTDNREVSAGQLLQAINLAESQWNRRRKQLASLRILPT